MFRTRVLGEMLRGFPRVAQIILLIVLPCVATTTTQSTAAPAVPEQTLETVHPGSISGDIYRNAFFGFSLEIPQGWKVADNAALRVLQQRNEKLLLEQPQLGRYSQNGEVDSPLLLMIEREPDKTGQHHRLIRIQCTDVSNRPTQPAADDFLKFVAEASLRSDPSKNYSNTLEPATLGGREFWKIHFTQKSNVRWHGEHLATIDKKHVLQVVLTSPDEAGLPGLEAILRTLHFEEH
jgi:hypothetical protein